MLHSRRSIIGAALQSLGSTITSDYRRYYPLPLPPGFMVATGCSLLFATSHPSGRPFHTDVLPFEAASSCIKVVFLGGGSLSVTFSEHCPRAGVVRGV